jgi:hypothetical protein
MANQVQATEAEFIIPANDHHGHNERLWCRVPPGLMRQMVNAASSGAFPYKGEYSALVRHAIVKHLKWLETLAPIESVLKQVEAINELAREDAFYQDFTEVFDKVGSNISRHISEGRVGMAKGLLRRVAGRIEDMPMGDWQEMYELEFNRRFGHVLEGQAVSLKELLKEGA